MMCIVDTPKYIKAGTYTLVFSLDTKTKLGVISSKRKVEVLDSEYHRLTLKMYDAKGAALAKATADLLAGGFGKAIRTGEACSVSGASHCGRGKYPGQDKLGAVITWATGKNGLVVSADVRDAQFSMDGSNLQVFISPTGTPSDLSIFTISPKGSGGEAEITVSSGPYGPGTGNPNTTPKGMSATWKRTSKGYSVKATIPWKTVREYRDGWTSLPVNAAVNSRTSDGPVQMLMGEAGDPARELFTYTLLKAK